MVKPSICFITATEEQKHELVEKLLVLDAHSDSSLRDELTSLIRQHRDNVINIEANSDGNTDADSRKCYDALVQETILTAYLATKYHMNSTDLVSVMSTYYKIKAKRTLYEIHQ